jgi:histidinol-phosphate phosphatase family protein
MVPKLSASLRKLAPENFRIGVITNQPDISRGLLSRKDLARMNSSLANRARASGIRPRNFTVKVCPHSTEDRCACRKPKTELIRRVMRQFKLDPKRTRFYMVGDRLLDLQTMENYYSEALKPLGIPRSRLTTILLVWKYGDPSERRRFMTEGDARVVPDFKLNSFESAVNLMIRLDKGNGKT